MGHETPPALFFEILMAAAFAAAIEMSMLFNFIPYQKKEPSSGTRIAEVIELI